MHHTDTGVRTLEAEGTTNLNTSVVSLAYWKNSKEWSVRMSVRLVKWCQKVVEASLCKVLYVILVLKDGSEGRRQWLGEGGNGGDGKKFSDCGDEYI